jgi:hypothetical protein
MKTLCIAIMSMILFTHARMTEKIVQVIRIEVYKMKKETPFRGNWPYEQFLVLENNKVGLVNFDSEILFFDSCFTDSKKIKFKPFKHPNRVYYFAVLTYSNGEIEKIMFCNEAIYKLNKMEIYLLNSENKKRMRMLEERIHDAL